MSKPTTSPKAIRRRTFLSGSVLPAAYVGVAGALAGTPAQARDFRLPPSNQIVRSYAARSGPNQGKQTQVLRDFADPYLELICLLREASEVEHALMVQYLYGAFSIKPAYAEAIVGASVPSTNTLLGVAIQEMQHLAHVNELIVALGGAPHLTRQDFPYESDFYPFEFNLEPLSRASLAKYVYTEAPGNAVVHTRNGSSADAHFVALLDKELGTRGQPPNHVGTLYEVVIERLKEYIGICEPAEKARLTPFIEKLTFIKEEGEVGHYKFFRSLFTGTHPAFTKARTPDVWSLKPDHPDYPSFNLPVNPSAFIGHPNQIPDRHARQVAWLGNLHYWTILLLTNLSCHQPEKGNRYEGLARLVMIGPFKSIATHLPTMGTGMPYEPFEPGYSPGNSEAVNVRITHAVLQESLSLARQLAQQKVLPPDYSIATLESVAQTLTAPLARS